MAPMLSLRFLLFVVFFYELCEISLETNPASAEYYKKILESLSLNVSETSKLNFTTLNIVLERLKLDKCSAMNQPGCSKCLTSRYLYKVYGHSEDTDISYPWFQNLSTALLFSLLPEKNAGPRNCQNGAVHGNAHRPFLKYYGESGLICRRLLGRILRDINETFKDSITKPCFSVTDLFRNVNLSAEHDEIDAEKFSTISVVVISYLLKRQCITLTPLDKNDLELPCRSYFTSDLVGKYGDTYDGYIPVNGFKNILEDLKIGKSRSNGETHDGDEDTHDGDEDNDDTHSINNFKMNTSYPNVTQCYSPDDLLHIFDINENVGLNSKSFKEICPALVQQVVSKACLIKEHIEEKDESTSDDKYVWLYGFASVLVISLLSLAGIAVIPAMKGQAYKKIIIVLVGLAIGTLAGDALLHLIPHAAGFHATSHGHDSKHESEGKAFIFKFLVVACGVYGFFLFETFTHLFLQTGGHGHSHNIEHTRKHSPFERNNSCRNGENHEMRFVASAIAETMANEENPEVIYNNVSRNLDAKTNKPNCDRDASPPSLLGESAHGQAKKVSGVAWMIIIGDTIHNITDGIVIGAAFSVDIAGGLSTSIAVFCHELPHELGDFAVLVSSGMTVKQAMLANFLSACSSFIGLIIGILIGKQTEEGSQWVFAIMGGMFLYIALVDMLPELMHSEELGGAEKFQIFILQNVGMLSGFVIMFCISYFEDDLKLSL